MHKKENLTAKCICR